MGKEAKEETLAEKTARLERSFRRRVNDTHIFIQKAIPLLELQKQELETKPSKGNRRYSVPSIGTNQVAQRSDSQLREVYDRFIARELYENLIANAVSQFESFLFDVLRLVISAYPKKLNLNVKGAEVARSVPLDVLLNVSNLAEALNEVIEKRLNDVSYAAPKDYLEYVSKITGLDTSEPAFSYYIEIKATRDLIIHNSGVINEIYLAKVGKKARGEEGEKIEIDAEYFNHCVATLKRVSRTISHGIEQNFK